MPTYLTEFDCTYHEAVEGGATFAMLFDEIEAIVETSPHSAAPVATYLRVSDSADS
ncbi:hypothetical protein [Microbacterium sp. 18062]|uniref:hypothetical protein n=1 Tax=Microbacterium sp. 18062 TaxID=2681410 RepID=UPI00190FBA38|nr:hypothetical protein [Microbacterium sp. 18062]